MANYNYKPQLHLNQYIKLSKTYDDATVKYKTIKCNQLIRMLVLTSMDVSHVTC